MTHHRHRFRRIAKWSAALSSAMLLFVWVISIPIIPSRAISLEYEVITPLLARHLRLGNGFVGVMWIVNGTAPPPGVPVPRIGPGWSYGWKVSPGPKTNSNSYSPAAPWYRYYGLGLPWYLWKSYPGSHRFQCIVPLWILLLISTVFTGILWRIDRHPKGFCSRCGYNLTGNTSGICPECGTRCPLAKA
jgi:hypothetical protein